jgi:type II secretory pathway predicted ATPase ExeA/chromosome segregation ATPase
MLKQGQLVMYSEYYGLSRLPFEDRCDPQSYVPTGEALEVLAGLEYAVTTHRAAALLIGDAGVGKTLALRVLAQRLKSAADVIIIPITPGPEPRIYREVAKGFGVVPSGGGERRLMAQIRRALHERVDRGRCAAVVFDRAEHLSPSDLERIEVLSELARDETPVLTVILAGLPRVAEVLSESRFARLRQRCFAAHTLHPMTEEETAEYVRSRIRQAGAIERELFTPAALEGIHRETGGVPRLISTLCHEALVVGYGAERPSIDADIIEEVASNLVGHAGPGSGRVSASGDDRTSTDEPWDESTTARPRRGAAASRVRRGAADAQVEPADDMYGLPGGDTHIDEDADENFEGDTDVGLGPSRATTVSDRLEYLIRRGERLVARQEAQWRREASEREGLLALIRSAEDAAASLAPTVRRVGTMSKGLAGRITQVESMLGSAEARSAEASAAQSDAKEAEARLRALEEEVVGRLAEAQRQVALLTSGLEAGEGSYDRLLRLESESTRLIADGERRLGELHERVEYLSAQGLAAVGKLDDERIEESHQRVDQQRREVEALVEKVWESTGLVGQWESRLQACESSARRAAERVEGLNQAVDVGQERIEQLHGRLREADAEVTATSERVQQVQGVVSSLDAVHDRAQSAMVEANAVQSRLQRTTHDAGVMHEAIKSLVPDADAMVTRLDSHHSAARTLVAQMCEATVAGRGIVERLERSTGASAAGVLEAEDRTRALAEALEQARTQVAGIEESGERAAVRLRPLVDRGQSLVECATDVCGRMEAAHTAAATLLSESARTIEQLSAVREQAAAAAHLAEDLATRGVQGSETVRQLTDRVSDACVVHDAIKRLVGAANGRIRMMEQARRRAGRAVRTIHSIESRASSLAVRFSDDLRTAEGLRGTLARSIEQVGDALSIADRAAARVEELRDATGEAARLSAEMHGQLEAARRCTDETTRTTNDLQRTCAERATLLLGATSEAEETSARITAIAARLETRTAAAGEDLERRIADGAGVATRLEEASARGLTSAVRLDEVDAAAQATIESVQAVLSVVRDRIREVNETISSATAESARLHGVTERATEASQRGTGILERLGGEVAEGTRVLDGLRGAIETAATDSDSYERRRDAEAHAAAEWSRLRDGAERLLTELRNVGESMGTQSADLTALLETARQQSEDADRRIERAEQVSERLGVLSRLVAETGQSQRELGERLQQAGETRALIDEILGRADGAVAALDRHCGEGGRVAENAQSLIATLRTESEQATSLLVRLVETGEDAGPLVERLHAGRQAVVEELAGVQDLMAQLIEQAQSAGTGQRLLTEFIKQVEELDGRLRKLDEQTGRIAATVAEATSRPQEVLAAAQAQTGQLEALSAAVRKVFAAVSQTSLSARNDRAAFEATVAEASKRLTALQQQTQRSSQTLRQWVEEAKHAQARLAATLERCPPISETHPATTLEEFDQLADRGEESPFDREQARAAPRDEAPSFQRGGRGGGGRIDASLAGTKRPAPNHPEPQAAPLDARRGAAAGREATLAACQGSACAVPRPPVLGMGANPTPAGTTPSRAGIEPNPAEPETEADRATQIARILDDVRRSSRKGPTTG